jgi:hypothetical protein
VHFGYLAANAGSCRRGYYRSSDYGGHGCNADAGTSAWTADCTGAVGCEGWNQGVCYGLQAGKELKNLRIAIVLCLFRLY